MVLLELVGVCFVSVNCCEFFPFCEFNLLLLDISFCKYVSLGVPRRVNDGIFYSCCFIAKVSIFKAYYVKTNCFWHLAPAPSQD